MLAPLEVVMVKHNAKGRSKTSGKFVMLLDYMTRTEAWRDLRPAEVSIYLLIAMRYNGRNNGHISLSVREAANYAHVAPGTAQKALKSLQEHGFIICRKKGAFKVKQRHATEWELTVWSSDRNKTATHDYKKWKPPQKQNTVSNRDGHGINTAQIVEMTAAKLRMGIN